MQPISPLENLPRPTLGQVPVLGSFIKIHVPSTVTDLCLACSPLDYSQGVIDRTRSISVTMVSLLPGMLCVGSKGTQ